MNTTYDSLVCCCCFVVVLHAPPLLRLRRLPAPRQSTRHPPGDRMIRECWPAASRSVVVVDRRLYDCIALYTAASVSLVHFAALLHYISMAPARIDNDRSILVCCCAFTTDTHGQTDGWPEYTRALLLPLSLCLFALLGERDNWRELCGSGEEVGGGGGGSCIAV